MVESGFIDAAVPAGSRSGRRAAAAVAAAMGLIALGLAGWWATHPSAFQGVGNEIGYSSAVGDGVIVGVTISPSHEVELRDVKPVVSSTGRADITIHLCDGGASGNVGSAPASMFSEFCPKEVPIAGATLPPNPDERYVLVKIVARSPGTILINGYRVRYVDGLQRGVQRAGVRVAFTAR